MLFFNYKSNYTPYTKLIVILGSIIFYTIIYVIFDDYHFNHRREPKKKTKLEYLTTRLYDSIIIQPAVGIGNVDPTTNIMRAIISSQAIITLIIGLM